MRFRTGCKGWTIAAAAAVLDRITKIWAVHALAGKPPMKVLPGIVRFVYAENRGMAFSMLSGQQLLLSIVSLAVIAGIVVYLYACPTADRFERAGFWMVAGGAVGNLYDRVVHGFVVDFICPEFVDFAVFNVADVFVCAGVFLVLVRTVFLELRKGEANG